MSDPDSRDDNADDDKGFLARWSQRKQEAKQPASEPPVEVEAEASPVVAEEPLDLSFLPKLEDVTATTDISGFMRKGVPEGLRNAALSKSWALDPAIRNYVNPALDYAYDWNTPGGVPGSGDIAAGMDIAKMVSQIMGSGEQAAEAAMPPAVQSDRPPDVAQEPENVAEEKPGSEFSADSVRLSQPESTPPGIAEQDIDAVPANTSLPHDSAAPQQALRRHGTAKPIV